MYLLIYDKHEIEWKTTVGPVDKAAAAAGQVTIIDIAGDLPLRYEEGVPPPCPNWTTNLTSQEETSIMTADVEQKLRTVRAQAKAELEIESIGLYLDGRAGLPKGEAPVKDNRIVDYPSVVSDNKNKGVSAEQINKLNSLLQSLVNKLNRLSD